MFKQSDQVTNQGRTTVTNRLHVILYACIVFLYWIALYLYVPTLPIYARTKTDSLAMIGVILSMYGLWQGIVRLPLGIASDWVGRRKPFIMIGVGLAGLGAWLMAVAEGAYGLSIGRAITGLAAATWVPLVAEFSTFFRPEQVVQATAAITLVGSVGRVLATSVTGFLNESGGYELAFFLASGCAVASALLVLLASERRRTMQRPSIQSIGHLVIRRDVILPSLLNAANQYASYSSTYGFLPILAKQLGATDVIQGILVATNIGLATAGNLASMIVAKRVSAGLLVGLSYVALSLGIGLLTISFSITTVFLAQMLIGLSWGIGYPILMGMSIEHVAGQERTTAMGLHQSLYAIGMFSGPFLSGLLADAIGIRHMFAVTTAGCAVLGIVGTKELIKSKRFQMRRLEDTHGRTVPDTP